MRQQFDLIKQNFHSRKGQADLLKQTLSSAETQIGYLKSQLVIEADVLKLLQAVSASTWTNTKTVIESIITRGLRSIFFDKTYSFVVNQEVKRSVPSVSFAILDDGMELDVVDEVGGGIADVVSLLLRLAFMILYRPKVRQLLVLDESAKHLSSIYQPYLGKFLKQVCAELGITILMVTHQAQLAEEADQIFRISKTGKTCKVS